MAAGMVQSTSFGALVAVEQCDTEVFEDYNSVGLHGESATFLSVDGDQAEYFSPPTLTKTWFHQGPVGDEFGEWEEVDYSDELLGRRSPGFGSTPVHYSFSEWVASASEALMR